MPHTERVREHTRAKVKKAYELRDESGVVRDVGDVAVIADGRHSLVREGELDEIRRSCGFSLRDDISQGGSFRPATHALGGATKSLLKMTYSIIHTPLFSRKTHRNLPRSRRFCPPSFGTRFKRKSPLA